MTIKVSGKATLLNSKQNMKAIEAGLQLAKSLEEFQLQKKQRQKQKEAEQAQAAAEKLKAKEQKTKKKREEMQKVVTSILSKLELNNVEDITTAEQLQRLNGKQLEAVYWLRKGKGVQGAVSAKRTAVAQLLGIAREQ